MKQNDYQKILADLKRFDAEVCHRQVKSVAGAAFRFVEEQLQQPYASLVLYDPDKKSLRVLTRSEEDTVSSEPFPAGDPPEMIAMAMEKGAFESACALPSGVVRGCEPTYGLKRVTAHTNNPAQWPNAQAQWKLKPPSQPVTSRTSPNISLRFLN